FEHDERLIIETENDKRVAQLLLRARGIQRAAQRVQAPHQFLVLRRSLGIRMQRPGTVPRSLQVDDSLFLIASLGVMIRKLLDGRLAWSMLQSISDLLVQRDSATRAEIRYNHLVNQVMAEAIMRLILL